MQSNFITVICPARNEEAYIENVIKFFLSSEPPDKELFIIDGNSTDRTRDLVLHYVDKHTNIYLLDNPQQTVPYALNQAIKVSSGNPIVRLDSHTDYSANYFEKILETFGKTNADIVGGPMRAQGKTDFQKAVAYCTSTKMGVGDSQFHNENFEGYVDSVYLGAWKREIFKDVGYFDERMKRNQDDEFHYRAKSKGKKIYLNPEIHSTYYPRSSVQKLFIQYYQYGLYKPLVLKKIKSEIKLRHLIPSAFVLYLLTLLILLLKGIFIALTPLLLYFLLSFYFSMNNNLPLKSKLACLIIYPALHISYGTGFIVGLFKK